jgi:hypothetical protein
MSKRSATTKTASEESRAWSERFYERCERARRLDTRPGCRCSDCNVVLDDPQQNLCFECWYGHCDLCRGHIDWDDRDAWQSHGIEQCGPCTRGTRAAWAEHRRKRV